MYANSIHWSPQNCVCTHDIVHMSVFYTNTESSIEWMCVEKIKAEKDNFCWGWSWIFAVHTQLYNKVERVEWGTNVAQVNIPFTITLKGLFLITMVEQVFCVYYFNEYTLINWLCVGNSRMWKFQWKNRYREKLWVCVSFLPFLFVLNIFVPSEFDFVLYFERTFFRKLVF